MAYLKYRPRCWVRKTYRDRKPSVSYIHIMKNSDLKRYLKNEME